MPLKLWPWPPVLLTAAAIAIISGDLCGASFWGGSQLAALLFFAGALLCCFVAFSRWGAGARETAPRGWRLLAGLLLVHAVIAVAYCRLCPATRIDTFTFQQASERRMLQGVDPYGQTEPNVYTAEQTARFYGPGAVVQGQVQVGLQYPPLTLLWILPGYLLGDLRYSYVAAVLLTGLLLYALAPNRWGMGLALLLLLDPYTFIVENRAWTEPLLLLALAATVYAARKGSRWLPLALGTLVAGKQYSLLALPLAALLVVPFAWGRFARLAGGALAVAVLTYLPFAVWNAHGLVHDLVVFHLAQPFRVDALSFAVVWPVLLKLGPWLVVAFVAWAVGKMRGATAFAAAYGVAVMLFFTTGKQAFTNYFFLIAGALMVAAAAWTTERAPGRDAAA